MCRRSLTADPGMGESGLPRLSGAVDAVQAGLGLTHAAAVISYRWFEGPMMRLGRGLEGARPAPEAALPERSVDGEGKGREDNPEQARRVEAGALGS